MSFLVKKKFTKCDSILHWLPVVLVAVVTVLAMLAKHKGEIHNINLQGGQTTHSFNVYADNLVNAFSFPAANLSFKERSQFALGNSIFRRVWVSSPASTKSTDGLGPLFNARSCQRCHLKDGRGHPPKENSPKDNAVSMLLRASVATSEAKRNLAKINSKPHPALGGQLQDFSLPGIPNEGKINITYEHVEFRFPDGSKAQLQKPSYRIEQSTFELDSKKILLSPRVAQPMIGLGLLEAIAWKRIESLADPSDQNQDGVSGRIPLVWTSTGKRLKGRFGWKATQPDLKSQVRGAFLGDMGLTTGDSRNHWGDCTETQEKCRKASHGADAKTPEVTPKMEELVIFYSSTLSVPPRRNAHSKEVYKGEILFKKTGCATCHVPSHKTANTAKIKALRNQKIFPYTDLLVHDMGEGLSDHRPVANLSGTEWRTPPLWGIGYTKEVSGHTRYLHDGRARTLEEAILWHQGESEVAKNKYASLKKKDRLRLISFLESL